MRTTVTLKEIGGGISHVVAVDGRTIAGITDETGIDKINHFIELVKAREDEISAALIAAEERRNWNRAELDAGRKGRDWPAFRRVDKIRKELCKQANIIDS